MLELNEVFLSLHLRPFEMVFSQSCSIQAKPSAFSSVMGNSSSGFAPKWKKIQASCETLKCLGFFLGSVQPFPFPLAPCPLKQIRVLFP